MHPEYETGLWTIAAQPYPSGYVRGMIVRRRQATAALVVAALLTSGCGSPAAPPTPELTSASSSPVDDDAAAFAAAEATYRAYVDALNAVDLSDPATFEPVYALTTGDLEETDREGLESYHADNVTVTGSSVIELIQPVAVTAEGDVELAVCLNVDAVVVWDSDGNSLVSPDRVSVQSLLVSVAGATRAVPEVSRIAGREGAPAC